MSKHQWNCTDPVLQSYEFADFHAQITWKHTVALWHGGVRLGEYGDLDLAWEAMSEQPSEQNAAVRTGANEIK